MRRSSTAPKKPESTGLMGFIGSLRKNARPDPPERRKSRSHRDEDARYMTDPEREERRARREARRRRAEREAELDGFVTEGGPVGGFPETDMDEVEARRAARRAKRSSRQAPSDQLRESEWREAEERRARRRERERAREQEMQERMLREEEEREARRQEERRLRRAAREERRAREEAEAREAEEQAEAEARAAERRERRRRREAEMQEAAAYEPRSKRRSSRHPVDDRAAREFYLGGYDGERAYRPERSTEEGVRPKRRKSRAPEPERGPPMMSGGRKDKTSSWVHSQASDPPEPPPVVATVVDMPPGPGEPAQANSVSSDEEARRELRRRARRRARYPGLTDQEIDELRARKREARRSERSSGSADYERVRGMRSYDDRYAPPVNGPRMPNWFKRLTNLG